MSNTGVESRKSKIGGQALIEGIMMKGIYKSAMACRLPDGEIDIEVWDEKNGKNAPWYRKFPIIRGSVNMVTQLIQGYKCLMKSADKQMDDGGEEEMTPFEIWLTEKLGDKMMPILSLFSIAFSLIVAVVLFKFLPTSIASLFKNYVIDNRVLYTIVEGVTKIGIFIAYLAVTSLMKDIRITYMYHGAEHKSIACYEAGDELTIENIKKYSRFHPRCGTSFLFIALFISIFVFSFIPPMEIIYRIGLQIVLLPLVVGISYELIKIAGRYVNPFTKAISAPGLALQRLTTREPTDKQIEVAIAALSPCIPEDLEDDVW